MSQKEQLAKLADETQNRIGDHQSMADEFRSLKQLAEAAFLLGARAMQEKAAQNCDQFVSDIWEVEDFRDQALAVKQRAVEIRFLKPEELL